MSKNISATLEHLKLSKIFILTLTKTRSCGLPQLATYLGAQEKRVDYESSSEAICGAFSNLNKLIQGFPTQERAVLNGIYQKHIGENIAFHFINYNYTGTLDKCLDIVKRDAKTLGSRKHGSSTLTHSVGQLCHVHGTIEKEMVFGVNDDSQISKVEVFDCENGDLYKNMLIKNRQMHPIWKTLMQRRLNSSKTAILSMCEECLLEKLINCGGIEFVPGLPAIVNTIYLFKSMEPRGKVHSLLNIKYLSAVVGKTFHGIALPWIRQKKDSIEGRIHVTGENIFESIKDIAVPVKSANERMIDEIEEISVGVR